MFNVIFTCVGRRVELVRSFSASYTRNNIDAHVLGVDANPLMAPAGYFGKKVFLIPRATEREYAERLLSICRQEDVKLLIPLFEPEFEILAACSGAFAEYGTTLLLSDGRVLEACSDKYRTYRFFIDCGINTCRSWLPAEFTGDQQFPLFIKPRSGMGSSNAFKINSRQELSFFLDYVPDPIVQEYIEGIEYTMDVLNDFEGRTISVVPRERIEVRAGEVSKSRTVKDWNLIEQTREVAEKLGGIGPLTIQAFRRQNGEIVFTEINPRFGGGVPLAIKAGVDYPMLLAKMVAGEKVWPMLGEFTDNLYMLRYDEALYLDEDTLVK